MQGLLTVILIILGIFFLAIIIMYNGFISRRNAMRNAFASIDVQLKRRWELIPNLVQTVQGYADHERKTLESVIHARNAARDARSTSRERFNQEDKLSQGLGHLLAVAEDYPDLKANEQFLNLQRNLTETESQISASRRAYNAAVTEWNEGVEMFPGSILAGIFNFETAQWFEARSEEREAVRVEV